MTNSICNDSTDPFDANRSPLADQFAPLETTLSDADRSANCALPGTHVFPWGRVSNSRLDRTFALNSGESVDSTVVLGRGDDFRNRRVEIAEELWRAKRSSKIFASGMLDAEFIIEQLKKNGVVASALSGERCSQSTEENALFSAAVLRPQDVQKNLLITDPPHVPRSMLSFQASGFTVIPHASPLPSYWETERSLPLTARVCWADSVCRHQSVSAAEYL